MDEPVRTIDDLELTTGDGVTLRADLAAPHDVRAAAIVCHPHPQYGGTRHDHVVGALFDALPRHDVAALRFDFRRPFDGGRGEQLDARTALDEIHRRFPDVPVIATGYSFGAMIALAELVTQVSDTFVTGGVLVAAPLTMTGEPPRAPQVPMLVVVPAHDQFCDPDAARAVVAGWPDTTLVTVEMADHFLHGRTAAVAEAVTSWLEDLLSRR